MKTLSAFEGGLAGAAVMTLIHEAIKYVIPKAPRLDLLGQEAISKSWKLVDGRPSEKFLYPMALAGDLLGNAIFYSIAGIGKRENALARGGALGLVAGIAAVMLPGPLGLSDANTNKTIQTKAMTIGLYVAGGIVAAAIMKWLERNKTRKHHKWEQKLVTSAFS